LHNDEKGREHLKAYYRWHAELAHEADQPVGFVLESVTWRANLDWLRKLGYGPESLKDICPKAINLLKEIRVEYLKVPLWQLVETLGLVQMNMFWRWLCHPRRLKSITKLR
jgi:hypothetical protein